MSLDGNLLILSLVPSGIGFVLFIYGKKQQRWLHLAAGIAFMVYPYFTQTVLSMAGVGVGLALALYLAVQSGY